MRSWMAMGVAGVMLAGAMTGSAALYYVNDGYDPVNDVYTTAGGNDVNSGTAPDAPKLTIAGILTNTFAPGDIIYIDTGTYAANVVLGATVVGAAGNRIVFQGSTNLAAGGTKLTAASGNVLEIRGRYLEFRDIQIFGGAAGIGLNGASFNEFFRVNAITNSANGVLSMGLDNSNAFRRCIFYSVNFGGMAFQTAAVGNYVEHCILGSVNNIPIYPKLDSFSNIVNSILVAPRILSSSNDIPRRVENCVFSYTTIFGSDTETLADVQRIYTNWIGNTVADPKFANAAGLDFHLLSAAGYVSNGVWVTNPAVGFSPAIDFGPRE